MHLVIKQGLSAKVGKWKVGSALDLMNDQFRQSVPYVKILLQLSRYEIESQAGKDMW